MTPAKTFIAATSVVTAAVFLSAAEPRRVQYAPLSTDVVNATCLASWHDMVVSASAYSGGYLMCITTDANAEGVSLYRESSPGSQRFSLVLGAGGIFTASDLVDMGVPAADANALHNSIQQQMQSYGD